MWLCCYHRCTPPQTLGPYLPSRYRSSAAINEANARAVLQAFISAALRRGEKQLEAFVAVSAFVLSIH